MAMLPRVLFPAKPIVSYGTDIAHLYFHEAANSASSLTWLGDAWVNGGVPLTVLDAVVAALALTPLEAHIGRVPAVLALPLAIVLASVICSLEGSLPLTPIGSLRSFLVMVLLWGLPLLQCSTPTRDLGVVRHARGAAPQGERVGGA